VDWTGVDGRMMVGSMDGRVIGGLVVDGSCYDGGEGRKRKWGLVLYGGGSCIACTECSRGVSVWSPSN